MKALLINPSDDLGAFLGKGKDLVPIFEPLGLLYISSLCKKYGHEISVIDAFAENLSIQDIKNIIVQMHPNVVGLTSFISNGNIIYELGRWIKKEYPDITTIFGNIHAGVYAEAYLRNKCCDIVVHGEGEYTFPKILNTLERGQKDFFEIPSISFLEKGKFITTSEPVFIENLSELPLPDRDAVKQKLYNIPQVSNLPYSAKKNGIGKHMFTARGCPFSCSFCVINKGKKQRFNSIVNVVDEMEILMNKYSANYIFIMDSVFTSVKKRVIDICQEIKRRGLSIKWGCEGHVNCIDQELIEEMESAGCHDIAFGIESGVQHLLDRVNKGVLLNRVEEAVKTVKNNTKIKVSGLFILGLPGEAYRDSLKTIEFANRLPLDMAQFSIFVPYPGSPIFYEFMQNKEIDTGMKEDGSLDTSVWLRYSPYISYTSNEPIWVNPGMTFDSLKRLQKKALRNFYFRPKAFYMQLKRIRLSQFLPSVRLFFNTFFENRH